MGTRIISIVNQKGGVGKTTTSINLAVALSMQNKRVLLIDFDQQANATIGLGIKREDVLFDITDFFTHIAVLHKAIIASGIERLKLIPASIKLANIEESLYQVPDKEFLLDRKLKVIKKDYDYILIDCPPSLGLIVDNALFASDSVIIPVECGYYSYDALNQMIHKINILLTKLDNRNTLGYEVADKVNFLFPDKVFKTIITYSSHIQEAPMHGKSVVEFSFNSRGSKEYRLLAEEIINKNEGETKDVI